MSCLVCQSRAELFLCNPHLTDLRANLVALAVGPEVNGKPTPGLLDALADVVLKQTRLGTGGGHRKRGDELPAPFIPDEERLDKDGHVKLSRQGEASWLMGSATNMLGTIIRALCEDRGAEVPELANAEQMAAWLARHAHAIAMSEDAGQTWSEIDALRRTIERLVDRPVRRVWLGECPSWDEQTRTACGISLWAPEDAVEVHCRRCRTTHNVQRLQLLLQNDLERTKVPWEKILRANKAQPEDRQIPERTLQQWRASGRLKPSGYRRPDGRVAFTRHGDEDVPLYLWPDVRRLRDQRPQKDTTGAAAHSRNRVTGSL